MKVQKKILSAAAYGAFIITILACGGSSGSGGTSNPFTGTPTSQLVSDGTTQINNFVLDVSTRTSSAISTNQLRFRTAADRSDATPAANAGAGIMSIAAATDNIASVFGQTLRSNDPNQNLKSTLLTFFAGGQVIGGRPKFTVPTVSQILPTEIIESISTAKGSSASREYPSNPTHAQVVAAVQASLANLELAKTYLDRQTPTDANPMVIAASPTQNVRIGTSEIIALRATTRFAIFALNVVLAYNLDINAMNLNVTLQQLTNGRTSIGPNDYLTVSGLGSLNSNGQSRMQAALASIRSGAELVQSGLTAYQARVAGGGFAIEDGLDTTSASSDLSDLRSVIDGQVNVNVSYSVVQGNSLVPVTISRVIDLPAFMTNPPTSLRSLMRSFSVSTEGNTVVLSRQYNTTSAALGIGGLFTTPLPSDVYSEAQRNDSSLTFSSGTNAYEALSELGFFSIESTNLQVELSQQL